MFADEESGSNWSEDVETAQMASSDAAENKPQPKDADDYDKTSDVETTEETSHGHKVDQPSAAVEGRRRAENQGTEQQGGHYID